MNIAIWLPVLACVSLVIYSLMQRFGPEHDSAQRLALLVGARRVWGETDASLRRRAIALSRWPYTQEAPELLWWARLWRRHHR